MPKRELYEFNKGKIRKNPFQIVIPDEFNAYKIEPSPEKGYTYFLLPTQIGVAEFGKNLIKNIHFELRFESVALNNPQITIKSVAPTDSVRDIGTVNTVQTEGKSSGGSVSAQGGADFSDDLVKLHIGAEGNIAKKSDSQIIIKKSYPAQIEIVQAIAVGRDAIWEFMRGAGAEKKGQYELNVVFRIEKPEIELKDGMYRVIPRVVVNGEEIKTNVENKFNHECLSSSHHISLENNLNHDLIVSR